MITWFTVVSSVFIDKAEGDRMAVTIDHLASETGVSRVTVSRALRGVGRMSQDTRTRILVAAKRLKYRPNAYARGISTGRFGSVGLLLDTSSMRSEISPQFLTALTRALSEGGNRLLVGRVNEAEVDNPDYLPDFVREWAVDGIVSNYHVELPPHILRAMQDNGTPWVEFNRKVPHRAVYADEFRAGVDVTDRLLAQGHRRIAYVDHAFHHFNGGRRHYSREDRLNGYLHAMNVARVTPQVNVDQQPLDRPGLIRLIDDLLHGPQPPTALIGTDRRLLDILESLCIRRQPRPAIGMFLAPTESDCNCVCAVPPWEEMTQLIVKILLLAEGNFDNPPTGMAVPCLIVDALAPCRGAPCLHS